MVLKACGLPPELMNKFKYSSLNNNVKLFSAATASEATVVLVLCGTSFEPKVQPKRNTVQTDGRIEKKKWLKLKIDQFIYE